MENSQEEYRLPSSREENPEEDDQTVQANLAGGFLPSILNRIARRLPSTATVEEFLEELNKGVFDGDADLDDLLPMLISAGLVGSGEPVSFLAHVDNNSLQKLVSRKYLDHRGKPVFTGVQVLAATELKRRNRICIYDIVRDTDTGLLFMNVIAQNGQPDFRVCLTEIIPRSEPVNDMERAETMEHNLRGVSVSSIKNNEDQQRSLVEYLQVASGCGYPINPALMDIFLDWSLWMKGALKHKNDQAYAEATLPQNTMAIAG